MKSFLNILWQIITWIGAIYIEIISVVMIYFIMTTLDARTFGTSTDYIFEFTFVVLPFLLLAGLYICVLAFYYAYLRNKWIHPYRLLIRRILSMSALLLSVFPMLLLGSFIYRPVILFFMRNYYIDASVIPHMLLLLCSFIAVPTLCIYVFRQSRPDRYQKKFLNEGPNKQP